MTPLFVTSYNKCRDLPGLECISPEALMSHSAPVSTLVVEPSFYSFDGASNSELGFPFMAIARAKSLQPEKLVLCFTYTPQNAKTYKGYLADVKAAVAELYPEVAVFTVPFVSCGTPMSGTVLLVVGSAEKVELPLMKSPVMPSVYFPGMISHVMRNRAAYSVTMGGKQIGAVRSDLKLLPSVNMWADKSLMVEYRKGNTSELRRLENADVGKLFGVTPQPYSDTLYLCLPSDVVIRLAAL